MISTEHLKMRTAKDEKFDRLVERFASRSVSLTLPTREQSDAAKPAMHRIDHATVDKIRFWDGNGFKFEVGPEPHDIGNGLRAHIVSNENNSTVIIWYWPAGLQMPLHAHEWNEDHFVAVGRVTMVVNNQSLELMTGGRVRVLSGQGHAIVAQEPTTLITVTHPALLPDDHKPTD